MSRALVHFLRRSNKARRQVFDSLVAGLREGKDYNVARREALRGVDFAQRESEFWDYVATLEK